MKVDIYDLLKTALENNHLTFSVQGWPAAILGMAVCGTIAYIKTIEVNAAEASDDSQQNNWPKAA